MLRVKLCVLTSAALLIATAGTFVAPKRLYGEEVNESEATEPAAPSVDMPAELRINLGGPRQTLEYFFEKMKLGQEEEAAVCLDLSQFAPDTAAAKDDSLALKLKHVIDRVAFVIMDAVEADQDSNAFQLSTATFIDTSDSAKQDAARIMIAPDADGLWKFTPATVEAIDEMYQRWRWQAAKLSDDGDAAEENQQTFALWLSNLFPRAWHETHFLIEDYLWICLFVVIVLGCLADIAIRTMLVHFGNVWLRESPTPEERKAQRAKWLPVGLLVQAWVWYVGTAEMDLPKFVLDVLLIALRFFVTFAGAWAAFRIIDMVAAYCGKKAAQSESKFDDLLVPLLGSSLKVLAVFVGIIIAARTFGIEIPPGLLGGLGLGGAALALASKDAISNYFGSFTVLFDHPFEIGDWIVSENIEGEVETVGFRSTRIRTFHNSMITLPNSRLTTAVVDNMGKRRYRRVKMTLGVQYDTTPEQIDAFCEGIRELIRRHPYTRKDYYHVYLNSFGTCSLDILLYCFLRCPDWSVELRERHRLMTDIMKLARDLGVDFAFPTRTLHMFNEETRADPPRLDEPQATGRVQAASIAGPLLAPDQRPGRVEFTGPTRVVE